jgi:hypothetical protein
LKNDNKNNGNCYSAWKKAKEGKMKPWLDGQVWSWGFPARRLTPKQEDGSEEVACPKSI